MAITLPLTIKIMFDKRSGDAPYIAYCPELEVASCGPTEEKARCMLWEAVDIVLKDAHKRGTLEKYLKQVGFFEDEKKKVFISPKVSYEPYYLPVPKYLDKKFACLAQHLRAIVVPRWKETPEFVILNNLKTAKIDRKTYFKFLGEKGKK